MLKPQGTKVKLRKIGDRLDLIVPRHQSLSSAAIHQIILTAVVDVVAVILLGVSLWICININRLTNNPDFDRGTVIGLAVGLMFILPLALWMLMAALKNSVEMCKQLFSDTSVSIDRKHVAMSTQFINFDWGTIRRIKVKDIQRVVVTDFQYIEGVRKKQAPCYLVLELDRQNTVNLLVAEHRLSKAEAIWLGKEVSHWLGVELSSD